jgi:hypothetical protein
MSVLLTIFLATVPAGLALLAGFALSVRNFYRHGRPARLALVGYLLILIAFTSNTAFLALLVFTTPASELWRGVYAVTHTASFWTQYTTPPVGFALLAWAAFAGRKPNGGGGAG